MGIKKARARSRARDRAKARARARARVLLVDEDFTLAKVSLKPLDVPGPKINL